MTVLLPPTSATRDRPSEAAPHPLVLLVAERFRDARIRWCLLRGEDDLVLPTGDVDLLVHPDDLDRAERTLRGLGSLRAPGAGRATHRKWVLRSTEPRGTVAFDLVTELAYGRYHEHRLPGAVDLLADRSPVLLPTLPMHDRFWLALLHVTLDGAAGDTAEERAAKADELRHLAHTPGVLVGPLATHVERLLAPPWDAASVLHAVRQGDLPPATAWRDPLHDRVRALWSRVLRKVNRPRERRRRSLVVALLGPDGAGKSSALRRPPPWPFPVLTEYAGPFRSGLAGGGLRRAFQQLRLLHRQARRQGALLLLDRHPYDVLALDGATAWKRRLQRIVVRWAFPRPDLVVVLDAPGEVLHERSRERDPATLERQRQAYLAVATSAPGGASVTVDATAGPADVDAAIVGAVWDAVARRTSGRGEEVACSTPPSRS